MNIDWNKFNAAIWRHHSQRLRPVTSIDPVDFSLLVGIERQKKALIENTQHFLRGGRCHHALLWGARGTGKSSLIKALLNEYAAKNLRLIEILKSDLHNLIEIVDELRDCRYKFIVYCDDFSFSEDDNTYRVLKTVLDGSIEVAPDNILLYVTSNRRHLLPEFMQDNLESSHINGEVHYSDTIEEKISLSDRFGLWLSFYPPTTQEYLQIVDGYLNTDAGLRDLDRIKLHEAAKRFSRERASKSGRTAKQFYIQCLINHQNELKDAK